MELEQYFQKGELIPVVVQEHATGEVLMLAYMNRESLQKRSRPATPGFTAGRGSVYGIRGRPPVICRKWSL